MRKNIHNKKKIFGEITQTAAVHLSVIKGIKGYRNNGEALTEALRLLHEEVTHAYVAKRSA